VFTAAEETKRENGTEQAKEKEMGRKGIGGNALKKSSNRKFVKEKTARSAPHQVSKSKAGGVSEKKGRTLRSQKLPRLSSASRLQNVIRGVTVKI